MNTTTTSVINEIRVVAKIRHEKARKAAKKRGRNDFPMLPIECSWAFEMAFARNYANGIPLNNLLDMARKGQLSLQ